MRTLTVRLTDRAALTHLALDENGETLEENFAGTHAAFQTMMKQIEKIVHRYCIDGIIIVANDWGGAVVRHFSDGSSPYGSHVWRNEADQPCFWLNKPFMDTIPVHDNELQDNEEILRRITDFARHPVAPAVEPAQ